MSFWPKMDCILDDIQESNFFTKEDFDKNILWYQPKVQKVSQPTKKCTLPSNPKIQNGTKKNFKLSRVACPAPKTHPQFPHKIT